MKPRKHVFTPFFAVLLVSKLMVVTAFCAEQNEFPQYFQIIRQPDSQNVRLGTPAQFNVTAEGKGLGYQWLFRSLAITGATNAALTIKNVTTNNVGPYRCVVFRDNESQESLEAELTAFSVSGKQEDQTVTLWALPKFYPSFTLPPKEVKEKLDQAKPVAMLEADQEDQPLFHFADLKRRPQFMFAQATNLTFIAGGSPWVGLPGTTDGCFYIGSVNFRKPTAPFGWQPIAGVPHSAQDITRGDTCVKFFGNVPTNTGLGSGGFVNVTPISSSSYRFAVYFPSAPVPTGAYPLQLRGFQP